MARAFCRLYVALENVTSDGFDIGVDFDTLVLSDSMDDLLLFELDAHVLFLQYWQEHHDYLIRGHKHAFNE